MTLNAKDHYFRGIAQDAASAWPDMAEEYRLGPGHPKELLDLYDRLDQSLSPVLAEVLGERLAQDAKWGEQNHPQQALGAFGAPPHDVRARQADHARRVCDARLKAGTVTWEDIFAEEWAEARAEVPGTPAYRAELVQCAAVLVAMIESVDRNGR